MASYLLFYGLRPRTGRGLRFALILGACILCGCSREEDADVAGDSILPAVTNSQEAVMETTEDIALILRRTKELGERLRKHRQALLDANPEMAEVWKTGLGQDEEGRAAQRKIRAFYLADKTGMELEEAYKADMDALREAQDRAIEKMAKGERKRFDPRASADYEPRKGSPDGRPRSLSGTFERREK